MREGYQTYPDAHSTRSGARVGWRTYLTQEEAECCAAAAKTNAAIDDRLGYEFGFMLPGTINKVTIDDAPAWEVCVP